MTVDTLSFVVGWAFGVGVACLIMIADTHWRDR